MVHSYCNGTKVISREKGHTKLNPKALSIRVNSHMLGEKASPLNSTSGFKWCSALTAVLKRSAPPIGSTPAVLDLMLEGVRVKLVLCLKINRWDTS